MTVQEAVDGDLQLAPPRSSRRAVLAQAFSVSAGLLSAPLWRASPSFAADSEDDDEEDEEEVEVVKPKVRQMILQGVRDRSRCRARSDCASAWAAGGQETQERHNPHGHVRAGGH